MPNKKWTVMVWMAGDNNLQDAGEQDLREMKKVGSTNDIDVVADLKEAQISRLKACFPEGYGINF